MYALLPIFMYKCIKIKFESPYIRGPAETGLLCSINSADILALIVYFLRISGLHYSL